MDNPVVIVTGGGRGIGRAICRKFAAQGAQVLAVARDEKELGETKRLVNTEKGVCEIMSCNVASSSDVEGLIEFAVSQWGRIDVLVNNAGVAPNGDIESFDLEVFEAMIGVNVMGVFYTSRAVWPVMRKSGGVIINLSSMAAVDPFPGFAVYGASKAFVEALTRSLADEGRKCGIRVYAVGPGAVDTQMLRGPFPDFPDDQCLSPEDVAETVWSMSQPAYQYSSGQVTYVRKA